MSNYKTNALFNFGDKVKVSKNLPPDMDHFPKDFEAFIIRKSYVQEKWMYGVGWDTENDFHTSSWYPEFCLEKII